MHEVAVGAVRLGNRLPMVLIGGPCQLEGSAHAVDIAGQLAGICADLNIGYVFKASFDKANRSAEGAPRGPGLDEGLAQLQAVKAQTGVPVLTDIHEAGQCGAVAEVADILQIPAFLCRQTDLLHAAATTGKVVNVKKGQFLAPQDMGGVVGKLQAGGASGMLLTERGTSFGYRDLVADMRALPLMAQTGWPVIMDATHAVQSPGGQGTSSGGDRRMAPVLARAAIGAGVAGVFIETHPDPDRAPSDGPNMIALSDMRALLETLVALDAVAKASPVIF